MTEPPLDPPPDPATPPSQLPPAPQYPPTPQYPQYPPGSPYPPAPPGLLPPNPRPIRPARVFLTILVVFVVHIAVLFAGGVFGGLWTNTTSAIANWLLSIGVIALFIGCIGGGIYQLARGDRGIGVGLLVGWGLSAVVGSCGACVAVLYAMEGA